MNRAIDILEEQLKICKRAIDINEKEIEQRQINNERIKADATKFSRQYKS